MHVYNAAMEGSGGSDGPRGLYTRRRSSNLEKITQSDNRSAVKIIFIFDIVLMEVVYMTHALAQSIRDKPCTLCKKSIQSLYVCIHWGSDVIYIGPYIYACVSDTKL
jgi:hypothetical protein